MKTINYTVSINLVSVNGKSVDSFSESDIKELHEDLIYKIKEVYEGTISGEIKVEYVSIVEIF